MRHHLTGNNILTSRQGLAAVTAAVALTIGVFDSRSPDQAEAGVQGATVVARPVSPKAVYDMHYVGSNERKYRVRGSKTQIAQYCGHGALVTIGLRHGEHLPDDGWIDAPSAVCKDDKLSRSESQKTPLYRFVSIVAGDTKAS